MITWSLSGAWGLKSQEEVKPQQVSVTHLGRYSSEQGKSFIRYTEGVTPAP